MSDPSERFQREFDVSRETLEDLRTYERLITQWTPKINLIAKSTLPDLWDRHFRDSAQIFGLIPERTGSLADFGSGGGFPGLVLALLAKTKRPDLKIDLVESDQRKSAFLRTVKRETGINVEVHALRINDVPTLDADVITARALASLNDLCGFAEQHLGQKGFCLFPKGAKYRQEIEEALVNWTFSVDEIPSLTAPDAVILKIGDIARV